MLELGGTNEDEAGIRRRIKVLSDALWEGNGTVPDVNRWLENFTGKTETHSAGVEQLHAAHLLSHFTYFGLREVRELLTAMYRDLFRYEIIQSIRADAGGRADAQFLQDEYDAQLGRTRFLGVGNPSESGTHLLYYFRQDNSLAADLFPNPYQILSGPPNSGDVRIADPEIRRLVFVDDVIGTGTQAIQHNVDFVDHVRAAATRSEQDVEIWYLALFAKPGGLVAVRELGFDRVEAVHELNASQLAFSDESHVYSNPPDGIDRDIGRAVAERYGADVAPGNSFGYGEGQLMLGLHHNVPDHTLPIFWVSDGVVAWEPVFRRYKKELGE